MSWTNCEDSCQENLCSAVLSRHNEIHHMDYRLSLGWKNVLLQRTVVDSDFEFVRNGVGGRKGCLPTGFSSFCNFFFTQNKGPLPLPGPLPPPPTPRSATGEAVLGRLHVKTVASQRTRYGYPTELVLNAVIIWSNNTGRLWEQDGR